jgi:hypothetical protein
MNVTYEKKTWKKPAISSELSIKATLGDDRTGPFQRVPFEREERRHSRPPRSRSYIKPVS